MTFEGLVDRVNEIYENADASSIQEHAAIQFNIYGKVNGKFYLEIADGEIDIQPYEYYDRDAMFTCSGETLMKIADGKMDPIMAVTLQKMKVEGNIDKALCFKQLIDSRK